MLSYKRSIVNQTQDQINVLEQLMDNAIELSFNHSDSYPNKKELDDLFTLIEKSIKISNSHEIFLEIQLLLFLTIIVGLRLNRALLLNQDDWVCIEQLKYKGKDLTIIAKNKYCTKLILELGKVRHNSFKIFQILNSSNSTQFINLLLVMNGYEYVLTEKKLIILFGRSHYLRHGKLRTVREFLKNYYGCDSHIELLMELKLVNTVHYNTMLRN